MTNSSNYVFHKGELLLCSGSDDNGPCCFRFTFAEWH